MTIIEKNCDICGNAYYLPFSARYAYRRYCGKDCRAASKRVARTLVKKVYNINCGYCGASIITGNSQKRYCNLACTRKSERKRNGYMEIPMPWKAPSVKPTRLDYLMAFVWEMKKGEPFTASEAQAAIEKMRQNFISVGGVLYFLRGKKLGTHKVGVRKIGHTKLALWAGDKRPY